MTSSCDEYQKHIPKLLMGDLPMEERQRLERHLAECPNCRTEQETYARTIDLMKSAEDNPAPHHFFVYQKEELLTPWQLFLRMRLRWQAASAAVISVVLLVSIAAISRFQLRSDSSGWSVSFGSGPIDIAALREDILRAAEAKNREARIVWMDDVRSEFAHSVKNLTQKQQAELVTALDRLDSKFNRSLLLAEQHMTAGTQQVAGDVYRAVAQQREQDLDIINLRLDGIEASNKINARQTNTIIDTLLQEAELRVQRTGGDQ